MNNVRTDRKGGIRIAVVSLFCLLLITCVGCQTPAKAVAAQTKLPLYTYDLSPSLQYDLHNPLAQHNLWAEAHMVAALQGLVNRSQPRLYAYYITDDGAKPGRIDHFWLDMLRQKGAWLAHTPVQPISSITGLVTKFRPAFKGVVLYDLNVPATSNVAETVAGCDNLLPIPYDPLPGSLYDRLVAHGPHLPVKVWLIKRDYTPLFTGTVTGSAKCDAYMWAKRNYLDVGKCNSALMANYIDAWWLNVPIPKKYDPSWMDATNGDYYVARRAFFFDLSPWDDEAPNDDPQQPFGADYKTLCAILRSTYNLSHGLRAINVGGMVPWPWKYTSSTGGKHEPVAAEWHYASILSCYNAYMDADAVGYGTMANASIFSLMPLKPHYPQVKPSLPDWKKAGYVDSLGHVVPREYVAFYVGDYDSAAWMYERLPTIWKDAARGTIPMSWAFDPDLATRFPIGFTWTRATATANDHFIAGDSGAGYLNLGNLDGPRPYSGLPSGLETWKRHCLKDFGQFDITLTGFSIDGETPPMSAAALRGFADYSPDGVIGQKMPSYNNLIPGTNTPYLVMNNDMPTPGQWDDAINRIKGSMAADSSGAAHFHVFRTVLWYPSQLKDLNTRTLALPNVTIVDMYTLMGLSRLSLQHH